MVLAGFLSKFGEFGRVFDNLFRTRLVGRSSPIDEIITLPIEVKEIDEVSHLLFNENKRGIRSGADVLKGKGDRAVPSSSTEGDTVVILPVTKEDIERSGIFDPENKKPEDLVFGEGGSRLL